MKMMRLSIIMLSCVLLLASCSGRASRTHGNAAVTMEDAHSLSRTDICADGESESFAGIAASEDGTTDRNSGLGDGFCSGFYMKIPPECSNAARMLDMMMEGRAWAFEEELAWTRSVEKGFAGYCSRVGYEAGDCDDEEMALRDIEALLEYAECGTQRDMNLYSAAKSAVETYKTLRMYDRLIMSTKQSALKNALRREYAAWYRLNKALDIFMIELSYFRDYYSSKPMEMNLSSAFRMSSRYGELVMEDSVLVHGRCYENVTAVVSPEEFDELLGPLCAEEIAWHCEETPVADAEPIGGEAAAVAGDGANPGVEERNPPREVLDAFRAWMSAREDVISALPVSMRASYREISAQMSRRFYADNGSHMLSEQ